MDKKKMDFAGSWYPADAAGCEASIHKFLREEPNPLKGNFIGGIVPHAGWYYSGSIACRVIASLKADNDKNIDTIIIFGSHMHRLSAPFILSHGSVETPFGDIEVDTQLIKSICADIKIRQRPPHIFPEDNTLELQYPFIKYFYPKAKIIVCGVAPTLFADALGSAVASQAENLSRNIKIIGSTDMTHYGHNFGFTPVGTGKKAVEWVRNENDKNAVQAMKNMDTAAIIDQGLEKRSMCCSGAVAATISACMKMGAVRAVEFDYATSFEKSASDSFVGYAGVLYSLS